MRALFLVAFLTFSSSVLAQENPVVMIETSKGTIKIELRPDLTPITVENFLRYVDNGLYDGLIFHRVISGFMIQGGGFKVDMTQFSTYEPQLFINHADNSNLDYVSPNSYGYAAFGRVIEGMEVVDEIAGVQTGNQRGYQNVPLEPISIISVTREE